MGERNRVFSGDPIAFVSLPADGPGNDADDATRRDPRRVGSWPIRPEKGSGIAWTSGTFRKVLALPSCGGSDCSISALAIGRYSGREEDLTRSSFRPPA